MGLVAAASARDLVVGSGNIGGSRLRRVPVLTFVNSQSFNGATVAVDYAGTAYYFTIDKGSDKIWIAFQNVRRRRTHRAGVSRRPTRAAWGRAGDRRGGSSRTRCTSCCRFARRQRRLRLVLLLRHRLPERACIREQLHRLLGVLVDGQMLIPDGDAPARPWRVCCGLDQQHTSPDNRIDDLVSRVYALEGWANGARSLRDAAAPGSNTTSAPIQQALDYGDASSWRRRYVRSWPGPEQSTVSFESPSAPSAEKLTFSASQSFKRGESIQVSVLQPTVSDRTALGQDLVRAEQPWSGGSGAFYRTDASPSRTNSIGGGGARRLHPERANSSCCMLSAGRRGRP